MKFNYARRTMKRPKTQLEVSFARYVDEVLGKRPSVSHYATSVRTASKYLREKGLIEGSLFDVESLDRLKKLRDILYADDGFVAQNAVGNNMYSVGLNHFVDFLGIEEVGIKSTPAHVLTIEDIVKLDAPIDKPKVALKPHFGWNRDRVIVEQVLKADNYQCEIDLGHLSFVARRNGRPYLEGHHLIPLSMQGQFDKSLDVYANIIGLCPNCHRKMHFGRHDEIRSILKTIYELRAGRLQNSGLHISKDEFLCAAAG